MIDEFHGSGHEPLSGQRPAANAGNPRSPARPPGGLTGLERGLDGGRDELRGLRIDDDVPAQQHVADDLPGVRERAGRASGGGAASSPWPVSLASSLDRRRWARSCARTRAHRPSGRRRRGGGDRLVEVVLPDDGFLEAAIDWARGIASQPRSALVAAKRAVIDGLRLPLSEGLRLEAQLFAEFLADPATLALQDRIRERYCGTPPDVPVRF